jgi:hypothetical protein
MTKAAILLVLFVVILLLLGVPPVLSDGGRGLLATLTATVILLTAPSRWRPSGTRSDRQSGGEERAAAQAPYDHSDSPTWRHLRDDSWARERAERDKASREQNDADAQAQRDRAESRRHAQDDAEYMRLLSKRYAWRHANWGQDWSTWGREEDGRQQARYRHAQEPTSEQRQREPSSPSGSKANARTGESSRSGPGSGDSARRRPSRSQKTRQGEEPDAQSLVEAEIPEWLTALTSRGATKKDAYLAAHFWRTMVHRNTYLPEAETARARLVILCQRRGWPTDWQDLPFRPNAAPGSARRRPARSSRPTQRR